MTLTLFRINMVLCVGHLVQYRYRSLPLIMVELVIAFHALVVG